MTDHSRRIFLQRAGVLAGASLASTVVRSLPAAAAEDADLAPFLHGVASGDPLPDGVLLWTRATPEEGASSMQVAWVVATDVELKDVVASGTELTDGDGDFTVKVDVRGLAPYTTHYYAFTDTATGRRSLVGRTKTAPIPGQGPDRLRFGVVSCSSLQHGYFNGYATLAERNDVDLVIHLGDYLYEYAPGDYGNAEMEGVRDHDPAKEYVELADYRTRHGQYKLDPDLRRLHQLYPFVATWDDHETTDNSHRTGAANHTEATEGEWEVRLAAATRAYAEWMPIRLPDPQDTIRIYRTLQYGDLVDLVVMDTRIDGRDEQSEEGRGEPLLDDSRQLISPEQRDHVRAALADSQSRGVAWRLLCQQVMMMQFSVANPPDLGTADAPLWVQTADGSINADAWDGYPAERDRLYGAIREDEVTDIVVLTGDIHTSWAAELHDDPSGTYLLPDGVPGRPRNLGVEFVTPSITSANFEGIPGVAGLEAAIPVANPHIKMNQLTAHGYNVLDITAERVQSDWYFNDTVLAPSSEEAFFQGWQVLRGTDRLTRAADEAGARDAGPARPAALAGSSTGDAAASEAGDANEAAPGPSLPATGGGLVAVGAAALASAVALRRSRVSSPGNDRE